MTDLSEKEVYEFGEFRLIPCESILMRNGTPVPLTPKAFETLLLLVRRGGSLVPKSELLDEIWGDSFVEENAVSKCVWFVRNALGEDPKNPRFIQTVPKRGYRFVADVNVVTGENGDSKTASPTATAELHPQTIERSTPFRTSYILLGLAAVTLLGVSAWLLRAWLPGSGETTVIKSVTVVPLENASGDPAEDYFVAGITDELMGHLSRISELDVISLPTDMRGSSAASDPRVIGERLNVDAVLMGQVSRSGDRARITVQLTHAATGRSLWAGTYERDLRGVQSVASEIARTIADEVKITVSPNERERLASPSGVNPEAYDQYLKGRYFLNRQNPEDQDTAIAALERAVEIDPGFATAYAELAQAYTWKHFSFAPEQVELAEKAFVSSEKALSLDPMAASAYLARGRLHWTPENHFPHEKSIADYKRAIALNPSLGEAHNLLALVYTHIGLLDEALREAREGVRVDPINNLLQLRIGQTLNSQGKYEEALTVLRAIPDNLHPSVVGHQTAWALFNLGRIEEASAKLDQLIRDFPDKGGTFAGMKALIAAQRGDNEEAEKFIQAAIEKAKGYGHFHHTAYTIACAYSLMNRPAEATEWLRQAAETGYPCYPAFLIERSLDNIRTDPRFEDLMERIRPQWEHFKSLEAAG